MAQAARAMQAPARKSPRTQPDIRVVPGRRTSERAAETPFIFTVFKLVLAVFLFLGAVGLVRVWFTTQTVTARIAQETLTTQVAQARDLGSELEVQQTILANPSRIKPYAEGTLGMVNIPAVSFVDINGMAAAVNSDGTLSLAGSISACSEDAAATEVAVEAA